MLAWQICFQDPGKGRRENLGNPWLISCCSKVQLCHFSAHSKCHPQLPCNHVTALIIIIIKNKAKSVHIIPSLRGTCRESSLEWLGQAAGVCSAEIGHFSSLDVVCPVPNPYCGVWDCWIFILLVLLGAWEMPENLELIILAKLFWFILGMVVSCVFFYSLVMMNISVLWVIICDVEPFLSLHFCIFFFLKSTHFLRSGFKLS